MNKPKEELGDFIILDSPAKVNRRRVLSPTAGKFFESLQSFS